MNTEESMGMITEPDSNASGTGAGMVQLHPVRWDPVVGAAPYSSQMEALRDPGPRSHGPLITTTTVDRCLQILGRVKTASINFDLNVVDLARVRGDVVLCI